MNARFAKKVLGWTALGVMLLATVLAGVGASGDEKYVKLISNTDQCVDKCETVYEVTAADGNLYIDWDSLWFVFKKQKQTEWKDSASIPELAGWSVWVNKTVPLTVHDSKVVPTTCTWTDNKTNVTYEKTCFKKVLTTETRSAEAFVELKPYSLVLSPGQRTKLKIVSNKRTLESIDNVLVLKTLDGTQKYTQWVWWNTSWARQTNITFNNSANLSVPDFVVPLLLRTTDKISAGRMQTNCNDIRAARDTTTFDYYIENNTCNNADNRINRTVIWANITTLTNGVQTYVSMLYNNSDATNNSNGVTTFASPLKFFVPFSELTNESSSIKEAADRGGGTVDTSVNVTGGIHGYARGFNGSANICFGDDADADITGEITVAAWVRMESNAGAVFRRILEKWDGLAGYGFVYNSDTNQLSAWVNSGSVTGAHAINIEDNEWHLIGFNFNDTSNLWEFFVDGNRTNILTSADTLGASTAHLSVGEGGESAAGCGVPADTGWAGQIDSLMIFNTSLHQNWFMSQWNATMTQTNLTDEALVLGVVAHYYLGTSGNVTARETTQQRFSLNITWNGTVIQDTNASFVYDGIVTAPNFENTTTNSSGTEFNITNYNVTIPIRLVQNNASSVGWYWNFTIGYANGSVGHFNTSNETTSVIWSYFISNLSLAPANLIEGESARYNATLTKLENNLAGLAVNFTYNNTNRAGSVITNASSNETWGGTTSVINLTPTNFTALLNATAYLTFNGSTVTRTETYSQINHTQWRMALTDCSAASMSTNITLRYDIFDEADTSSRVTTNSEESHTIYATTAFNRTFGFSRTSQNNWTICLFPRFTGMSLTEVGTVQYGDGVTWGIRSYQSSRTINQAQQNVSLYAINATGTGVALITIHVTDAAGVDKPGLTVEIYRRYLPNETAVLVVEDVTDPDGKIKTYLRQNDVYYRFKIYSSPAKTELLHETTFFRIFDTTVTIRLGAVLPQRFTLYSKLGLIDRSLSFDNATKQWTFTWNAAPLYASNVSFTLNNICLQLDFESNETIQEWTRVQLQCSTSTAGSMTTLSANTTYPQWRAWGWANISSTPATPYPIVMDSWTSVTGNLGAAGLFWGALIIITVMTAGIWNPAVAVAGGVVAMSFLGTVGIIGGIGGILVAIVIIGFVVMKAMRT